jgi:hypothetical protein
LAPFNNTTIIQKGWREVSEAQHTYEEEVKNMFTTNVESYWGGKEGILMQLVSQLAKIQKRNASRIEGEQLWVV